MDLSKLREDFPILQDERIAYLDNAATSQRPKQVLDAVRAFYEETNANPLRGLYAWSIGATERYEQARARVARFLGASEASEIIFTRNTTESINLVAYSYGLKNLTKDDEIVLTVMEHHSNILPWQMVAKKTGAKLVYMEPDAEGVLSEQELSKIGPKTAIVAVGMVSNVLGVTNPISELARRAHDAGAVIVVDGAQSTPHFAVDVTALDADFYAFSGHKMLAPMGIGGLYVKKSIMEEMDPFLTGGEMIEYVDRETATYAELPHKFEAGTVNAADACGLSAAMDYLEAVGFDRIAEHERRLTRIAHEAMQKNPHVTLYGPTDPDRHAGILTFNIEGCHPHDVASILDSEGICIRAGHHCAQPLMKFLGVGSTARASFYFYNTEEEVLRFAEALTKVRGWLGYGS